MPTEEKEEHFARCLLCGDRCWFDDRVYHRLGGWVVALVGWSLPLVGAELLGGKGLDEAVIFLVGVIVWLAVVAYLFLKQTVWVCRACGAMYPARNVRSRAAVADADEGSSRVVGGADE